MGHTLTDGVEMVDKLIRRYDTKDTSTLEDLLMTLAANIEDSLVQSGAVPGRDYTILDCFKLAQPFALSMFSDESGVVTYTI